MPASQVTDILLVANGKEKEVFADIATQFGYRLDCYSDTDAVLESTLDPNLLVVSEFANSDIGVDELLQICRQQFPKAFLILVVDKELTKERFKFVSKLGARLVLLKHELPRSKVPFAVNQILKASFFPLKSLDIIAEQVIPFEIYHFLPVRGKFIPILRANDNMSGDRLDRLKKNSEFYIQRTQMDKYKEYIEATAGLGTQGLPKRCRANFVALQVEFTNLVFELSDESNKVSYGEGQALISRCTKLCTDLLSNLAEFPNAWEVINNSSMGEFGSLERGPSVAAYCGILSLQCELDRVTDIMLAALLVDIAITSLSQQGSECLRKDTALKPEDLIQFKKIPQSSIDMVLARKLALPETLRTAIMNTYERADGNGYPLGVTDIKISKESQIIRLAKELDARTVLKVGRATKTPKECIEDILFDDPKMKGAFSDAFVDMIKAKVLDSGLF